MSRFTQKDAEAFLRAGDIFYWDEPSDDEPNAHRVLNMNDVFGWALAFGQFVLDDKIIEVADLYARYGDCGLFYWVSEQNNQMRSEFEDINRRIDFVRREEQHITDVPNSSERAYKKIVYSLGDHKP